VDRGTVLRTVAAVAVIAVVVVLVLVDRGPLGDAGLERGADPAAPPQATTGTVVPLPQDPASPGRGDRGRDEGRDKGRDEVPVPPSGIEAIACQHNQRSSDLTVVTFNTHRSYGPNGLARIAAEIRRARADVVLLQEIDRFWARTRYVDQPAWFAQRLGMEYVFGANVVSGRRQYGTATLTRFPVVDQQSTRLPNGPGGEQRGLLRTTLDVDGRQVSVYNTHLQNGMPSLRHRQSRVVAGLVRSDPRPVVLGGDFNAGPTSPTLRGLRSGLRDTWAQVGTGSAATHHGGARIDYLLASPHFEPTSSQVLPSGVSDHHLVRATYKLPAGPDCDEDTGS
jgi:endonuclease/exonuclease/phosphatase family metal-dependent hydrolase